MPLEYKILVDESDDKESLELQVQQHLNEGWHLHGGLSISHYKTRENGWYTSYAQAVVRERKSN